MSNPQRFILGGIGGLIPVILFAANGTLQEYFNLNGSAATAAGIVGFMLRVVGMFVLGGGVVSSTPKSSSMPS